MISYLSPAYSSFLNGINQIQARSQRAQAELTTGLKINSVSDSPDQIPQLLQTHAELDHVQQINTNLGQVKSETDTAETALQSAVTLVEQAQGLATQGQSGFSSADTRQQIAGQLGSVLQQLVGVANTSLGGRFLFAGDSDQTPPYSVDLTQSNPVSAYGGSSSTRQVEAPDGSLISVAKTAQDIFDSSDSASNVFQAVNNARQALLNNDQNGIDSALTTLKSADGFLNGQLAYYGTAQNRVAAAQTQGSTLLTQLQSQLSSIQDADATQAILDLQQASTNQSAALASFSKLPRSSLFDYLG